MESLPTLTNAFRQLGAIIIISVAVDGAAADAGGCVIAVASICRKL